MLFFQIGFYTVQSIFIDSDFDSKSVSQDKEIVKIRKMKPVTVTNLRFVRKNTTKRTNSPFDDGCRSVVDAEMTFNRPTSPLTTACDRSVFSHVLFHIRRQMSAE